MSAYDPFAVLPPLEHKQDPVERILALVQNELDLAEEKIEEAVAHISLATRYHARAVDVAHRQQQQDRRESPIATFKNDNEGPDLFQYAAKS